MVKIDQRQMQLGAPVRVPGQYVIRTTRNGLVVAKWPRKNPTKRTPAQFYIQTEFAMAASETAFKDGHQIEQAMHHAKGVHNVWRDFLTGAAYGTIVEFQFEDGTPWESYRKVTINAQLILDQVTDTVGAMLWRSEVGWIEVAPGSNGYYLGIVNGVPTFTPVNPVGQAGQLAGLYGSTRLDQSTLTLVNVFGGTVVPLLGGTIINALNVYASAAAATAQIKPAIYTRTSNTAASKLAEGATVTGVINGINRMPFASPVVIPATEYYFLGVQCLVAGYQQANSNGTISSFGVGAAGALATAYSGLAQAYNNNVAHPWID